MVTLTENDITVEAENIKQAESKMRAEKHKAAKAQKEKDIESEIACNVAHTIIGQLCCTAWDGLNREGELPQGYRIYPITHNHVPVRLIKRDLGMRTYSLSLPSGQCELSLYGADIISVLENGAGWPLVICTRDESGVICWSAVGHYNTTVRILAVPTILKEVLRNTKEAI